MSNVPKPKFWSRIGSPWLRSGSNSARTNPTASRNLLKPLPPLREPVSGPKYQKPENCKTKIPINPPSLPLKGLTCPLEGPQNSRSTDPAAAMLYTQSFSNQFIPEITCREGVTLP